MRGSILGASVAIALLAGPALAQTGVPVDRDWDPEARDFNRSDTGEGGTLFGTPRPLRGPANTVQSIDRELARPALSPKDRGSLLMMRAMLNLASGHRSQADRDIDRALAADPTLKYDLLASRARDMAAAGRTQPAIDMVDRALRDQPGYAPLITTRGQVRMMQGDYALALADFSQNADTDDTARRLRAQAYYTAGNYREAVDDLDHLLQSGSRVAAPIHLVLWRYANNVKLRRDARRLLAADLRHYGEPPAWPGPIAQFLSGRISAVELEIAAESDPDSRRSAGRCLATYFIAMETVRLGNRNRARELLQLTQTRCGVAHFAHWAATAELRRL
jgi:tetratricopeptide (TPR) repeat protein